MENFLLKQLEQKIPLITMATRFHCHQLHIPARSPTHWQALFFSPCQQYIDDNTH
jgi:hypothetical protein